MRGGYLLMGVGLALVTWPLLPDADSLPLYEGVTLCLLTATSLLAFLGLRYPIKLLPLLLFESGWKIRWLALVALPKAVTGDLDAVTSDTVFSCSLVSSSQSSLGGTCGAPTSSLPETGGDDRRADARGRQADSGRLLVVAEQGRGAGGEQQRRTDQA